MGQGKRFPDWNQGALAVSSWQESHPQQVQHLLISCCFPLLWLRAQQGTLLLCNLLLASFSYLEKKKKSPTKPSPEVIVSKA